jgi:hypothetical protein
MAKGTGGDAWRTSWSEGMNRYGASDRGALMILNFHYRIFTPLWL